MRAQKHTVVGVAILLIISGLITGCILEPREPEPPTTGEAVPYLDKTSTANAWANLERSLDATHAPGWEDNISLDTFIYLPDSDAETQFPGVFAGWDRDKEIAFINNFYNSDVTITAQLLQDGYVVPPDAGTEVEWEDVIYDLTVTENAGGSSTRYRGKAIITFRLEGSFWYIYRWRDQQGESDPETQQLLPTMGVLRGTFGSQ